MTSILILFDADKEIPSGFPAIIQNPGMKVVEKGRNAVLVCEAGGDPSPAITWIKDTMPVVMSGGGGQPRISMMQQGKLRGEAAAVGRYSLSLLSTSKTEQLHFFFSFGRSYNLFSFGTEKS